MPDERQIMKTCENCGTRLSEGICPNCHEELYIYQTQYEELPETLSEKFAEKVNEQARRREESKDAP